MTNTILQITKLDPELLREIKDSFNELPETNHKDGKFRLRRYSAIELHTTFWDAKEEAEISPLSEKDFTQSEDYNKHQGGMKRTFENIEERVLQSDAFKEICLVFNRCCDLIDGQRIDVHQMRVKCSGGASQLSPEGWHQDGYDCVAMIGVDRNNIIGGEALLSTSKTESPFLKATLETGTMLIIDDSYLWHNGRSVQPINDDEPAWMDMLILTLKK